MKRNKRQSEPTFNTEDLEAATEEVNTRPPTTQLTRELDQQSNETRPVGQETDVGQEGDQTLNPDNPYNVSTHTTVLKSALSLPVQFSSRKHRLVELNH